MAQMKLRRRFHLSLTADTAAYGFTTTSLTPHRVCSKHRNNQIRVRRKGHKTMCGNNGCLWLIIILIILFACCGNGNGFFNGGNCCCDNNCNNNCNCGC